MDFEPRFKADSERGVEYSPLVKYEEVNNVLINFKHIDQLVGKLMQYLDLVGDTEQREALKRTVKTVVRDWIDCQYEQSGSKAFGSLADGVRPFDLDKVLK